MKNKFKMKQKSLHTRMKKRNSSGKRGFVVGGKLLDKLEKIWMKECPEEPNDFSYWFMGWLERKVKNEIGIPKIP